MRPRMYMTDKEEPSYPRQCRGHKPVLFQSLRQGDSGWRFPSVVMRWPSRHWQVWHTNTSIAMLSHRFKKCCMHPKDLELDHTVLTNILKFYKVVYCLSNTDFSFDHFLLAGCGDRRWSRTREAMSLSHSAEVINKRIYSRIPVFTFLSLFTWFNFYPKFTSFLPAIQDLLNLTSQQQTNHCKPVLFVCNISMWLNSTVVKIKCFTEYLT